MQNINFTIANENETEKSTTNQEKMSFHLKKYVCFARFNQFFLAIFTVRGN